MGLFQEPWMICVAFLPCLSTGGGPNGPLSPWAGVLRGGIAAATREDGRGQGFRRSCRLVMAHSRRGCDSGGCGGRDRRGGGALAAEAARMGRARRRALQPPQDAAGRDLRRPRPGLEARSPHDAAHERQAGLKVRGGPRAAQARERAAHGLLQVARCDQCRVAAGRRRPQARRGDGLHGQPRQGGH